MNRMSGYMDRAREGGVQWGAVAFGWVVAVAAGFLIGLLLRGIYALAAGPATGNEELTAAFVISLISGFLAYLAGGYAAGRMAGVSGGLNGAMTAVFGLVLGIVLAIILVVLALIVSGGDGLPTAPESSSGSILTNLCPSCSTP
jgi:heme/copper-type cytochrome/quinol oxidase subunit 4